MNSNLQRQNRRKMHVRLGLSAATVPHLLVFRSNKYMYAQVVDNKTHKVVAAVSDKMLTVKGTKSERAKAVGKEIAERAIKAKLKAVVFDRGPYKYHGRVKALAEGAREGGLKF